MLIELSPPRPDPAASRAPSRLAAAAVAPLVSPGAAVDFGAIFARPAATAREAELHPVAQPLATPSVTALMEPVVAADETPRPSPKGGSFLDELEQEVLRQTASDEPDREALERNTRLANTACRTALDYWTRLVEHLNALKPTRACRYVFDGRTVLERRPSHGFRVAAKMHTGHNGDEHFESVTLNWRVGCGERLKLLKEFPVEIDRVRARLSFAGINAFESQVRDPNSGRPRGTEFEFTADVNASVRLTPMHEDGKLRIVLVNLDALERTEAEFPAFALRVGELDELGRMICGRPSTLLKHAQNIVRHEP